MVQPRERVRYRAQFDSLRPINGVVTGEQAKEFLLKSQLPPAILGQIWYWRISIYVMFIFNNHWMYVVIFYFA